MTRMAIDLPTLALDLASFHNTPVERARHALRMAVDLGEFDEIRTYGVDLTDIHWRDQDAILRAIERQTEPAHGDWQRVNGHASE